MSAEPVLVKVKARDVVPGEWALWCCIEGGQPFANEIACVRWNDNGLALLFMLETFNTIPNVDPDSDMELVPYTSPYVSVALQATRRADHAKMILGRPNPVQAAINKVRACAQRGEEANAELELAMQDYAKQRGWKEPTP